MADFKQLIADAAGVGDFSQVNQSNFNAGLDNLDLSTRERRRVTRGFKRFNKANAQGRTFDLGDNSFESRNSQGDRLSGSGPRRGNKIGFNAGDLVGAGNSLGYLAGALQKQQGVNTDRENAIAANNEAALAQFDAEMFAEQNAVTANNRAALDQFDIDAQAEFFPEATAPVQGGSGGGTTPTKSASDAANEAAQVAKEAVARIEANRIAEDAISRIEQGARDSERLNSIGPLGQKHPDLYDQYLNHSDGAKADLELLDYGMLGDLDQGFKQWVQRNSGVGSGENNVLAGNTTFDFAKENNNFADLVGAAELVTGIGAVKGGYRFAKSAAGATKTAINAFKSTKQLADDAISKTFKVGEKVGNKLASLVNKGKKAITGVKNSSANKVAKNLPEAKVLKAAPKPKIKIKAPKEGSTADLNKLKVKITPKGSTKDVAKVVANNKASVESITSKISSKLSPKDVAAQVDKFVKGNRKKGILSDGTRVRLSNKGKLWEVYKEGGKIKASNLIR